MDFAEFIDRCMAIEYRRDASVTEFGQPMNCYGFVYWYYRLCRGIELDRDCVESISDIHSVRYVRTDAPVDGDVVDLRTLDGVYATHVGVFMDGMVYHFAFDGLHTKVVYRIPHMIKGYYHVTQDQKRDIQDR